MDTKKVKVLSPIKIDDQLYMPGTGGRTTFVDLPFDVAMKSVKRGTVEMMHDFDLSQAEKRNAEIDKAEQEAFDKAEQEKKERLEFDANLAREREEFEQYKARKLSARANEQAEKAKAEAAEEQKKLDEAEAQRIRDGNNFASQISSMGGVGGTPAGTETESKAKSRRARSRKAS